MIKIIPLFILLSLSSLVQLSLSLYTKKDEVIVLTPNNWKMEVESTKHAVFVEFFAPWCGHCKSLTRKYKKAATSLKGIAKVAAIDCDTHRDFCGKYGIQGFPTLKLFQGDKSKPPTDYNGARETKDIVDYVAASVPDKFVITVGETTYRESMEKFLKRDNLPKVVLFNQKYGIPVMFKALAIDFENKYTFGEVKSTDKDTVNKYQVTSFPSVLIFPAGEGADPALYDGATKHAALTEYLNNFLEKDAAADSSSSSSADSANAADLAIPELKTQEDLQKECLDKTILCFVAFLAYEPEFKESVERFNKNMQVLKSAQSVNIDQSGSFRIVWTNAIENGRKLMRDADVSDSLPALLALHGKRGFYRNFRGAFDATGVQAFFADLLTGKGQNLKIGFEVFLNKKSTNKKKTDDDQVKKEGNVKEEL